VTIGHASWLGVFAHRGRKPSKGVVHASIPVQLATCGGEQNAWMLTPIRAYDWHEVVDLATALSKLTSTRRINPFDRNLGLIHVVNP
jgi:hypothetical protein